LSQGVSSDAKGALPPEDINRIPDSIAAMAFSLTMRWYSTGEHRFWAIRSDRRAIVSHEVRAKSVIIQGRDAALAMDPALALLRRFTEPPQIGEY
jgi:hypothetical protein